MSYYRHRFVFFLLSPFFRLFLKIRYNFAAERYNGKKTANFILSNHVCTLDPFMVSMSFRAPIYFVTSEHIFKPRNYKASVVIDKLADLPKEYITYIEDVKANKKKLYEDLKAGTEINGAHLKANRGTTIK